MSYGRDWRALNRDELEKMIEEQRQLLAQRGNEMRRLLMEIVELIDRGEYGSGYATYMLTEAFRYQLCSREFVLGGIQSLERREAQARKDGDAHGAAG